MPEQIFIGRYSGANEETPECRRSRKSVTFDQRFKGAYRDPLKSSNATGTYHRPTMAFQGPILAEPIS